MPNRTPVDQGAEGVSQEVEDELAGEQRELYDAGYQDGKEGLVTLAKATKRGTYYKAGYADGMWERMSGEHSYDPTK
jgi:hypothetical protein